MILFCSTFFQLVFDQLGGQRLAQDTLTGLPGGFWGFVIIANIAVFLLGINLGVHRDHFHRHAHLRARCSLALRDGNTPVRNPFPP